MSEQQDYSRIIKDGLWDNNGVLAMLLGMCPSMAMTTSAIRKIIPATASLFFLKRLQVSCHKVRCWEDGWTFLLYSSGYSSLFLLIQ